MKQENYIPADDWQGPGWYTAQQIGAHENQRTAYNFVSSDRDYPRDYDYRGRGEGNPVWHDVQRDRIVLQRKIKRKIGR